MIKATKPKTVELALQFPHCDPRILHAPGECGYCDKYSQWQYLRQVWGICFTGYIPEGNETQCPAEKARNLDTVEKWGGNQAVKECEDESKR